jgi:hypothetical protein
VIRAYVLKNERAKAEPLIQELKTKVFDPNTGQTFGDLISKQLKNMQTAGITNAYAQEVARVLSGQ